MEEVNKIIYQSYFSRVEVIESGGVIESIELRYLGGFVVPNILNAGFPNDYPQKWITFTKDRDATYEKYKEKLAEFTGKSLSEWDKKAEELLYTIRTVIPGYKRYTGD